MKVNEVGVGVMVAGWRDDRRVHGHRVEKDIDVKAMNLGIAACPATTG